MHPAAGCSSKSEEIRRFESPFKDDYWADSFSLFFCCCFISFDRICLKLTSLIASPQRVPVNHLGQGVFLGPDGIQLEHPISLYIHIQSPKTFVHDGHPSLRKVFFFSLVIFFCKPDGCFFLPPPCVFHTHYICQCV